MAVQTWTESELMSIGVPWPRPPEGGYTADDLDRLPNLPDHTELIDGTLVFMSPRRHFHAEVLFNLQVGMRAAAPEWAFVEREMTIKIGPRQRPEPDLIVLRRADFTMDDTAMWYPASAVALAVEVISPDSEIRDRERKPTLYAQAGIQHFWLIDLIDGVRVAETFQLTSAGVYEPTGRHQHHIETDMPYPVSIAL